MNSTSNKSPSVATLIPLLWYMMSTSRGISRWLDPGSYIPGNFDATAGSPIDRLAFIMLIVLGIIILSTRKIDSDRLRRQNLWIFIIFMYMGLSVMWSEYMGISFKRWIKTIGDFIMALVILTDQNYLEAISRVLRWCFYIHIPLSILLIKYFRAVGVAWDDLGGEMWIGVTTHKNNLGELAMISGVYFIWDILRCCRNRESFRLAVDVVYLLMIFWILKGSDSSRSNTAIAVFGIGSLILLILSRLRSDPSQIIRLAKVSLISIVALYFIFQLSMGILYDQTFFETAVKASGRDMTLTGRTILWEDLIDIGLDNPLLGSGYGGFWYLKPSHVLWEKHIWKPHQGHNGYLDIFIDLGFVGIVLIFVVIYTGLKSIFRTFYVNFDYALLRLAFISMIIIHNITESNLTMGAHHLWFLFLLVIVQPPVLSQKKN